MLVQQQPYVAPVWNVATSTCRVQSCDKVLRALQTLDRLLRTHALPMGPCSRLLSCWRGRRIAGLIVDIVKLLQDCPLLSLLSTILRELI